MLTFKFDQNQVNVQITKNQEFLKKDNEDDFIKMVYWDEQKTGKPTDVYLAQFKKLKYNFIGVLDKKTFKRRDFGVERNQRDEVYAGQHKDNLRHGRGVYHFPNKDEDGMEVSSIYMGLWENNKKHGPGTYIWRRDKKGAEKKYESCLITAFVGWFANDSYDVGMFYEDGDDSSITLYYGKFLNNLKDDDEGLFYHYSSEEIYVVVCNIKEDHVKDGIKFIFTVDDKNAISLNTFIEFKYNDDTHENLEEGSTKDDMSETTKPKYETAQKFIDLLFKKEDFRKIYDASVEGEKAYNAINDIKSFNEKFVEVTKAYCKEGEIKLDNELRKFFPREGKFPFK